MEDRSRRIGLGGFDCGLQLRAPPFDLLQLRFPCLVAEAVQEQLQDLLRASIEAGDLPRRECELRPLFAAQAIQLFGEPRAELLERSGLEEPLLHCTEHATLDLLPLDAAPVRARPAGVGIEARQPIMGREDEPSVARRTHRQPREEILRSARAHDLANVAVRLLPRPGLPRFRRVPQAGRQDAQVRTLGRGCSS